MSIQAVYQDCRESVGPFFGDTYIIRCWTLSSRATCSFLCCVLYIVVGAASALADDQPEEPGSTQSAVDEGQSETKPDPMDEPLITDRPDFTESTDAVPAGHFQIEAGYTFTYDREGKDRLRDHTAPEFLLRIGVFEDFELRIGWNGYSWSENQTQERTDSGRRVTRESWNQGANDLSLGIKYKLFEQDGWLPHFGVIAAMSVPTGSANVGAGDVEPELVLLWAYDVNDRFSVAGNVGFAVPTDEGDRFFQTFASFSVAYALTEKVGTYAEYFGFYPNTEDSDCAHSVNVGATYLINKDFQIDVRVGAGLNEEADDFFTGIGFAWRI